MRGQFIAIGMGMFSLGSILGWYVNLTHGDFFSNNNSVLIASDTVVKRVANCRTDEAAPILVEHQPIEVRSVHQQYTNKINKLEQQISQNASWRRAQTEIFKEELDSGNELPSMLFRSLRDVLAMTGIDQETVDRLVARISENKMDLLVLRDMATREGWLDTSKYIEARSILADPDNKLHSEFGDEIYDHYLYAVGKSNRILIKDVIPNSEAETMGLLRGDMITAYASNSIFTMHDLRRSTSIGDAGEQVLVEFQRDGTNMYATVLRGPLGIEMQAASQIPER